jgi:hypothetical protein
MNDNDRLQVRLRSHGGVGANARWQWEVVDADGKVLKSGSHMGTEAQAFATATRARDRLTHG